MDYWAAEERRAMEMRLRKIARERRALEWRTRLVETEAGRQARRMINEYGATKSAVGRLLEVSQPHVTALIERAALGGGTEDPVPIVGGHEAVELLEEARKRLGSERGRLQRVIAAFELGDVLLGSKLDPEAFRAGLDLAVPQMMWQVADYWLGIDDVNIGYGGTGPGNAESVLRDAGVPEELVNWIYENKYIDADPTVLEKAVKAKHGLYGLRLPEPVGPVFIVRLGREDLRGTQEHGSKARFGPPSEVLNDKGQTAYEAWLELLNHDPEELPGWLIGERVARVFVDPAVAMDQGFTSDFTSGPRRRSEGPYTVIVQQGRLQLWLPTYPASNLTQFLSDEAYQALYSADLYPEQLQNLDERGSLARYLDLFVRRRRPGYFDVSNTGDLDISYTPVSA